MFLLTRYMDIPDYPFVDTTHGSDVMHKNCESKTRDVTQMKKCILRSDSNNKERIVVEFDGKNPIGAQRAKFLSYVGYLGRSKVSILIEKWKQVPEQILELLWQNILVYSFLVYISNVFNSIGVVTD